MILLSWWDLLLGASLLFALAALCALIGLLSMTQRILIAATRAFVQLLAIGFILKYLFFQSHPGLTLLMACVMLLAASYEVLHQQRQLRSASSATPPL